MLTVRQPNDADLVSDDAVREIIVIRMAEWKSEAIDWEDLPGHFLIVEPEDSMASLQEVLGFDLLENRYTGLRHGQPGYTPSFEMVERHGTFFEMVFILSDDGQGVVVVVPDMESVPSALLALCRCYAIPSREHHT